LTTIAAAAAETNAGAVRARNRQFLAAAATAFALFFLCDAYLFSLEGFRRHYGSATQEGQELSKVARARHLAAIADVALFGSSYVRSGVSGEPFLEQGIVPFNFAVSGGGPLFDYFALRRIAPVLRAAGHRPWIVVELKRDALEADSQLWAEYPQYLGIVRSRTEMLQFAPMLWRSFRDYNMTSQFLSGLVVPSSIYRSHAVQILGAGSASSLNGYFYGMEDFSGYSPLYTVAAESLFHRPLDDRPLRVSEGKRRFLVAFLRLASDLGCPIALYSSPTLHGDHDAAVYDTLVDQLRSDFPRVQHLRTDEYGLRPDDFDEGGHPNLHGADRLSRHLIARLGLRGDAGAMTKRLADAFEIVRLAPVASWTLASRAHAVGDRTIALDDTTRLATVADAPPIGVTAGREYVLEAGMAVGHGRISIHVGWHDTSSGRREERSASSPLDPSLAADGRVFLRFKPNADSIHVSVVDTDALDGRAPSEGRVEILRLWGDLVD